MLISISSWTLDGREFQIQGPTDMNYELYVCDSCRGLIDWQKMQMISIAWCFAFLVAALWDILELFHAGIHATDRLFCRLCIPWSSTNKGRSLWVLCGQTNVNWQQTYKPYSGCTEVYPRETQMFPAGLHCNSLVWKDLSFGDCFCRIKIQMGVDSVDVLEIQVCCGGNLVYMVIVSQQIIY